MAGHVFLSYKRGRHAEGDDGADGGSSDQAELLFDRLQREGFRPFKDTKSLSEAETFCKRVPTTCPKEAHYQRSLAMQGL